MGLIFQHANRVLVWLAEDTYGDAEDACNLILETNRHFETGLAEYSSIDSIPLLPPDSLLLLPLRHQAVKRLFLNSWSTRVWVLQEVGLAATAVVAYGNCLINWSEVVQYALIYDYRTDLKSGDLSLRTRTVANAFKLYGVPTVTLGDGRRNFSFSLFSSLMLQEAISATCYKWSYL